MPTPQRRHQSSLIRQLIDQPRRFHFFQAVRLLDLWLRRGAPGRGRTLDGALRFQNSVSLAFAGSEIEALTVDGGGAGDGELRDQADRLRIRLTPAFMGLLGLHGVLPYDYTETIAAQVRYDKNEGGRAFFDAYSHRSTMLFYRAWERCRVEYRIDAQGRDGFLGVQLALAGRRTNPAPIADAPDHDAVPVEIISDAIITGAIIPDEVIARHAALIRHRPMPAEAIAGLLADYFGVPFRLETFVGAWETARPEERTQLGVHHGQLGLDTMLGERYWRRDLCARLWIGPLARTDFERFLPGGSGGKALKAMLALFAVATVRFEVRPVLRAADVAPIQLDASARLGRGATLATRPAATDQTDARYYLEF